MLSTIELPLQPSKPSFTSQYLFVAVTLGSQAAVAWAFNLEQANLRIQGQPGLQGEFQNR